MMCDFNGLCARNGRRHDRILIIGAGAFGKRAVDILSRKQGFHLQIIDNDEKRLRGIEEPCVEKIADDGIDYLIKKFDGLSPSLIIVPALPRHLAFEWAMGTPDLRYRRRSAAVPDSIKSFFPHTWLGPDGSLLVSHADFRCPDDCPEPPEFCTVTKQKRGQPMYDLIRKIRLPDVRTHVIRSRQLAPGLGGYRVKDLKELLTKTRANGRGRWLIATACKCHGFLSAMEIGP